MKGPADKFAGGLSKNVTYRMGPGYTDLQVNWLVHTPYSRIESIILRKYKHSNSTILLRIFYLIFLTALLSIFGLKSL